MAAKKKTLSEEITNTPISNPSGQFSVTTSSTGGFVSIADVTTLSVSDWQSPAGTEISVQHKKDKNGRMEARVFFKRLKGKFSILAHHRVKNRIDKLWKLAEESEKTGQIAMLDFFFSELMKQSRESEIYGAGFRHYIEKRWIDKFVVKVKDRKVIETPMKNFTRIIPNSVMKKYGKALDLKLFDKYVILHYDPDETGSKMTKKEEEAAKRDPILFGKIDESSRYYFIDDWEDEYCDLTLDDIIDNLDLKEEGITLTKNPQKFKSATNEKGDLLVTKADFDEFNQAKQTRT